MEWPQFSAEILHELHGIFLHGCVFSGIPPKKKDNTCWFCSWFPFYTSQRVPSKNTSHPQHPVAEHVGFRLGFPTNQQHVGFPHGFPFTLQKGCTKKRTNMLAFHMASLQNPTKRVFPTRAGHGSPDFGAHTSSGAPTTSPMPRVTGEMLPSAVRICRRPGLWKIAGPSNYLESPYDPNQTWLVVSLKKRLVMDLLLKGHGDSRYP